MNDAGIDWKNITRLTASDVETFEIPVNGLICGHNNDIDIDWKNITKLTCFDIDEFKVSIERKVKQNANLLNIVEEIDRCAHLHRNQNMFNPLIKQHILENFFSEKS